jgi:hypothetical protein
MATGHKASRGYTCHCDSASARNHQTGIMTSTAAAAAKIEFNSLQNISTTNNDKTKPEFVAA